MKFNNWAIDNLIAYLEAMKHAPADRLDFNRVPRVRGEIYIENGEWKDGKERDENW